MIIKLEIHAPGLDLHHKRWKHHVMFMDNVHEHATRIAASGWRRFERAGRGALFVDPDHWMTLIKGNKWTEDVLFPCTDIGPEIGSGGVDTTSLRAGFTEMITGYDPEKEVVLLVEHYPGDQLSAYFIEPNVPPPTAADQMEGNLEKKP